MYAPDYTYSGYFHQERLREAEALRAHSKLVEEAMAYRRAHGEEDLSLLDIIAQRLHLKAQTQMDADEARRAHGLS